jgi:hypothetical protein
MEAVLIEQFEQAFPEWHYLASLYCAVFSWAEFGGNRTWPQHLLHQISMPADLRKIFKLKIIPNTKPPITAFEKSHSDYQGQDRNVTALAANSALAFLDQL